jgi:Glycoside-hydrolase family GH114
MPADRRARTRPQLRSRLGLGQGSRLGAGLRLGRGLPLGPGRRLAGATAAAAALVLVPLVTGSSPAGASLATAGGAASAATAASAAGAATAVSRPIPPPRHRGTLRISGQLQDGGLVTAAGLSWHPARLPRGQTLLSFEVGYSWQSCRGRGRQCRKAADSTATPFAARRYRVGHADTGRWLRVTETAAEVVETQPATFTFRLVQRTVRGLTRLPVRAYPRHQDPASAFSNGLPEQETGSDAEYFQVSAAHFNRADGQPAQRYRVDSGPWRAMPKNHAFYTGRLQPGSHQVSVSTANRAGSSQLRFRWRVTPLAAPVPCRPAAGRACWYPPHLAADHQPMRWDWQIGRAAPLRRTGRRAVDIYDLDGFLTTAAQVRAIATTWPASTLPHPRTVCYLDLAWEDYRPDASPAPGGVSFPAAALGDVYYGYPQERWVDLRQLDALEPMLRERISMCARKGFDAVELDDIDSFDPPSETGFRLTPGDVQNFLAYAFNEIHHYGMTGLWKNSPWLSWWGRQYADGAVVEECYFNHGCSAAQLRGSSQYGITCTALSGATPCGWDDFTADVTPQQRSGKWVGEAEYTDDHYVCNPGQRCAPRREFSAFCRSVYGPPIGFAAVKFDVDLDGKVFHPCPRGS